MKFFDVGVRFQPNEAEMRELGFDGFATLKEFAVERQSDLQKIPAGAVVVSQNSELLREAAKKKNSSLLLPLRWEPDIGLMRIVAGEKKAFEIPISLLLETRHVARAILMGRMRYFLKIAIHYNAPYIITSGARDAMQLRSAHELIAIGEALGLTQEQAAFSLSEYAKMVINW